MSRKRHHVLQTHESLLRRNFLIILILIFTLGAITLLSHFLMDDVFLLKAKHDMKAVAETISEMDIEDPQTKGKLSDLEASNNFYFEIYYPRDQLIYTTDANNSIFGDMQDDEKKLQPRYMPILEREEVDDVSYFEMRREFYATAKYLVYGTQFDSGVALEIYASVGIISSNADTTNRIVLYVMIFLAVLILLLFSIQSFSVTIPINKINRITKRLAQMDFDTVCPPFRLQEIDELSSNINRLSASLDMTLKTLRRRNAQLEQDIENEKQLLESRKQFIANASHELKTPIAIIQGYAEGLKYGIYDNNRDECYDVILEEAQKMNKLVIRLMEINRINAASMTPDYAAFSLKTQVGTFVSQCRSIFAKNGIKATCTVDEAYIAIADPVLFERVLSNYVSNAVSHCAGKKEIRITCSAVDDCYRIHVFNTGTPIADEDLPNIWNSFYRADKSHSRAEGRFGLGLPIVAAAQDAQKMRYGVENHADGVEFWFDVRKGTESDLSQQPAAPNDEADA